MSSGIRCAAATSLLLLAVSGCGPGDDGGDEGGLEDPGGGSTASTWTPSSDDCEDPKFPLPLQVETTVEAERPYLENVVACAGDQQYGPIWLHNVGEEVWSLKGGPVEWLSYTPESGFFAEQMLPDSPYLLPDDVAVVDDIPRNVSWTLEDAYTVAWEVQGEGIDQLEILGEQAVQRALKPKTPQGAALAACAFAGYSVADQWAHNPDGFEENLGAGLTTVAGGTSCASKWESAWGRKFQPTAQFLGEVDDGFQVMSRLNRVLQIVIR